MFAGLGVYEAVKQFASFQSQMERLRTQTGSTQSEVTRMSKGILDMAVSVGTGPQSLAQALYHVESAGYRGQAALDALRIAAEGAKVGGADLTDTTTGLTAVLVAGFAKGKNATEQLRNAMGELNATVGSGDMTFQDLNEALSTGILSTTKVLGLQVKDLGAALAVLGDNNIRGAAAATRLRMGLMQVVHPSDTVKKSLHKLHMGTLSLAEDLRKPDGLLVMLDDLKKHLGPLTTNAERTRAADILGGIFGGGRNSAAMLTLLEQLDRLRSKYDLIGKQGRSFNSDWQQTTKTLQFFLDQIKALGEVVLIRFGKVLAGLVPDIQAFIKGLKDGKPWAEAIAGAIMGIAGAMVFAKLQTIEWAAVMEAVPMVALFMAIGAAVLLLITHFKQVKAVAKEVWHAVYGFISGVWNWIKGHWPELLEILIAPFTLFLAPFAAIFHTTVPKMFQDAIKWIGDHWKTIRDVLEWPFKEGWKIISSIMNWIVRRVEWAVNQTIKLFDKIAGPLKSIGHFFGSVGGGIGHAASSIGHLFGFAEGTPYVQQSGAYMVGERGPEIVWLPRGSAVTPNSQLGNMGGPPSGELVIHLTTNVDGHTVAKQMVRQGLIASARRGAGGPTLADAGG